MRQKGSFEFSNLSLRAPREAIFCMEFIRPFSTLSKHDVGIAGGKGASLGEMTKAGIPVPPGFVILASAYNRLTPELEQEILASFRALESEFVAVRSSATCEDGSTCSWAGELETYLNTTEATLMENVKKCGASLESPRAISYREAQGMASADISVAVVVQKMVNAEVAGVAFTVHPVTKDTNQMIIEACWGLGEKLVGGLITPDAYVVDKRDGRLIDVNVVEQDGNEKQKLESCQIGELAEICKRIETHYGFPCDIEWAMESGTFFIVQSRPITTL